MVRIRLERYYEIDPYFKELTGAGLVGNRDYVYNILRNSRDDSGILVGIEFLDDRLTSFYGLKWA
jgi:hypothetical protein